VGTTTIPEPGTYRGLAAENQRAIHEWLMALQMQHGDQRRLDRKVGFWSHGSRRSGTTYLASVAVRRAVNDKDRDRYGTIDWEYATLKEACDLVRSGWDETARLHPNDEGAWQEMLQVERHLDRLWDDCDLLWLDDVHLGTRDDSGPINIAFFGKHIFPKLEYRVKMGKATVVSTSLTLERLGSVAPVVRDLFVMCEPQRATG
jgi:hypothetical protein